MDSTESEFSDVELDDDIQVAEQTHKRLTENSFKGGYRDGVTDGEELSLQDGFNAGYTFGFTNIYSIARLKGMIWAISNSVKNFNGLEELNLKVNEVEKCSSAAGDTLLSELRHLFVSKCEEVQIEQKIALEMFTSCTEKLT